MYGRSGHLDLQQRGGAALDSFGAREPGYSQHISQVAYTLLSQDVIYVVILELCIMYYEGALNFGSASSKHRYI